MTKTKEKNGKVVCPKCGKEMAFRLDGRCAEWVCPVHGIMLVTSYFTPEEEDTDMYSVEIRPQRATAAKIKLLTLLSCFNYLQAKKLLDEGGQIMTVVGYQARPVLEKLKNDGVDFSTKPEFPYKLK